MKKTLLALAALTAFAGVASAQSSVTLFGVVDVNARSTKVASTTTKSLSTDGMGSSRLGFRGVEDLGGGMRAGFWLESGLAADVGAQGGSNGISTVTFNRRATVSLMGGFGELRLGRDYTASFWNYTVFDPFGTNGVGAVSAVVSTLGSGALTFVRDNNVIGYFLPAMGGVYGQVQVAAGENVQGQKYVGGRLGYAGGPVNIAAAFGKTNKTGAMVDDYTDMNFGASYKMSFMSLQGLYSKRDYGNTDQKTWMLGTVIPFGASSIKASYAKTDGSSTALESKKFALGYLYSLSKRSTLYAHYAKTTVPGPNDIAAYEFGVNHTF